MKVFKLNSAYVAAHTLEDALICYGKPVEEENIYELYGDELEMKFFSSEDNYTKSQTLREIMQSLVSLPVVISDFGEMFDAYFNIGISLEEASKAIEILKEG